MKKVNYQETSVVCGCGNKFTVSSVTSDLHVEVCNLCHPFFTGKQGTAARSGKIEKFNKKYGLNKEKTN